MESRKLFDDWMRGVTGFKQGQGSTTNGTPPSETIDNRINELEVRMGLKTDPIQDEIRTALEGVLK